MHGQRLDAAIERVEGVVVRVLRGIASRVARLVGASPSPASLSDDDLQIIRRDWRDEVTTQILPAVRDVYAESAEVLAKDFADAGRPVELVSLEAPSAADFLDAATNRLVNVADTLWETARRELADGVRAGEGIEELAARLQHAGGFGEGRARTIARTEVIAAANAASLAQALRLGDPSMTKTWEDADDERVRPAHALADGQTVPLGEPFEVGGEWLMYPGQPTGSAANVINERCTPVYGWDDVDELLTASAPEEFHLPGKHDQDEHGKDRAAAPEVATSRVKDPLKLADRIRLKPGETFTGSATISASEGRINLAWIDRSGKRHLRFAAGQGAFGEDVSKWRAENKGFTAELDPDSTASLRGELDRMMGEAKRATAEIKRLNRDYDRFYATHGEEPRGKEASQAWRSGLPAEAKAELSNLEDRVEELTDEPVAQGAVSADWADLRFEVQMDEVSESPDWHLIIGVRPRDAPDDWELRDGIHGAWLSPAETKRLAKLLTAAVTAAVTADTANAGADPERDSMSTNVPLEVVTAAAEVHTGAMVALRPSAADAERLAVEGGEPADQLHCTLAYLGDAADIPPEVRQRIISRLQGLVEDAIRPDYDLPMTVDGFSVELFNPPGANKTDGKRRDTCIVLGLSGGDLDPVHRMVSETVAEVAQEAGLALPEQDAPWHPHATLIYTDDIDMVPKLVDRAGPVTFDAIRVAFGGENTDIPLLAMSDAAPKDEEASAEFISEEPPSLADEVGPGGWDAYFAARIAEFVGSDAKLREYWIRGKGAAEIRWPQPGAFRRCVRQLGKYVRDPEGLCAEYYREANGRWPGEKKDNTSVADTDDGSAALAADPSATGLASTEVDGEPSAPDPMAALPGEHFHTRVMEGVSTGMRQFAPSAITWRTPPFAYHWQWKSSAHNGLPETIQVGLVTRALRDDPNVHFWGRLDLRSPEGLDYARRLVEGFARWTSVGGDESIKDKYIDVEYVLADEPNPGTTVEDPEIDLMTFNQYRVAEISGVSVPALADATVEPTQELIDTLIAMGVTDPEQVASQPPAVEEIQEDEVADFAAVPSDDTPPADETRDAAGEQSGLDSHPPAVVVAAGHTITLPEAPPSAWFDEPADDELPPYGSVRVDAHGRLIGLLAPAQVNHRSFPGKRVKVPMGNVDYSGWMNKSWQVDDGRSINVGVITMDCGHASTSPGDWSYSNRREHYDNTCSIAAHARAYEKPGIGVALAGAIAPWLDAEGFQKLLSSDLSGDWPPHPDKPGWRDFIAALAVPVGGFANRARLRLAEGTLVAAAVPVQFEDDMEEPMEMEETAFVEGDPVRVVADGVAGEVVAVHGGPMFAVVVVEGEPPRWHPAEELEPADAEPPTAEDVAVEELVASAAGPDLRPVLDRLAKGIGRDPVSRMNALAMRVHHSN